MNDVPFDVFDDFDVDREIVDLLYKEGADGRNHLDAVSANYYLGRVKQNKEKLKRYEDQAKQIKDDFKVRVDNWLQSRKNALEFDTQHCLDALELYYESNKPINGKPLSLPEGNIGMYSVTAKYDFDSCKEEILKFLQDHPELQQYVRNKPEINKEELKKACVVKDGRVYVGEIEIPKAGYTPKTSKFSFR